MAIKGVPRLNLDPNETIKCLIPTSVSCELWAIASSRGTTVQHVIREACKQYVSSEVK